MTCKVPQVREDVPQMSEKTVELVKLVAQEQVQQRTVHLTCWQLDVSEHYTLCFSCLHVFACGVWVIWVGVGTGQGKFMRTSKGVRGTKGFNSNNCGTCTFEHAANQHTHTHTHTMNTNTTKPHTQNHNTTQHTHTHRKHDTIQNNAERMLVWRNLRIMRNISWCFVCRRCFTLNDAGLCLQKEMLRCV